jgi:methyl-accepting chemotaxis protein
MSITGMAELAEEAVKVEELQDALKHELIDLLDEIPKFTLVASLQAEHDEHDEHDEQSGIVWISISFVVALIVGSILPFIISRSIITPINDLSSRLAEIADGDGDLTVRLNDKAKDETGDVARALNIFLEY